MTEKKDSEWNEKELVADAKRGDKQAFGRLVKQYARPAYYLAYRFVRDHDLADELVQESFVKAWQALDSFIEGKSFKSWMFAIVSNLAINYLRRKKRETSLEDAIPDGILEDRRLSSNPHQMVVAKDLQARLAEAVANLPEEYRTVFILRTYEDMSYEDIAEALKIEPGTVMSRLFRARARLKEELKDYLDA